MAQARFIGNYDVAIDGKGRAMLPARFRAALSLDNDGMPQREIMIYPAEGHPCLEACRRAELDDYLTRVEADASLNSLRYEALMTLFAECLEISIDGDGRIVLPRKFMDQAGIEGQLRFIGFGGKFRLWSPERHDAFKAKLAEAGIDRELRPRPAAVAP